LQSILKIEDMIWLLLEYSLRKAWMPLVLRAGEEYQYIMLFSSYTLELQVDSPLRVFLGNLKRLNRKWDSTTILEHAKNYSWSELAKQILLTYQKLLTKPSHLEY
jgi:hypothetical protein